MEKFNQINKQCYGLNECNDCAIKAIALTTGLSYLDVHKEFRNRGRKNGRRVYDPMLNQVIKNLGFDNSIRFEKPKIIEALQKASGKTRKKCTVKDLEQYPEILKIIGIQDCNCLVFIRGHVAALIDNKIEDWSQNRNHTIKYIEVVFDI